MMRALAGVQDLGDDKDQPLQPMRPPSGRAVVPPPDALKMFVETQDAWPASWYAVRSWTRAANISIARPDSYDLQKEIAALSAQLFATGMTVPDRVISAGQLNMDALPSETPAPLRRRSWATEDAVACVVRYLDEARERGNRVTRNGYFLWAPHNDAPNPNVFNRAGRGGWNAIKRLAEEAIARREDRTEGSPASSGDASRKP